MDTFVIQVEHLRKTYGNVVAVDDVSFQVCPGEIFGMVGPNGAGKTTIIECCEGLRRPDRGRVRVLGMDPQSEGHDLRERIGIRLQGALLEPRLKVWEALDLFSSFYRRAVDWALLLETFGLSQKRNAAFAELSGGQKQRLLIAMALLNDPELVFLDELTTGLDPHARRAMWALVRDIRARGKTVFMTTHFMEEAERLCDRVAIVDRGRVIAVGSPEALIRDLVAGSRLVFRANRRFNVEMLRAVKGISRVERIGERVIVYGKGQGLVGEVVSALNAYGVPVRDLRTEQSTLEDVFLAITGREVQG